MRKFFLIFLCLFSFSSIQSEEKNIEIKKEYPLGTNTRSVSYAPVVSIDGHVLCVHSRTEFSTFIIRLESIINGNIVFERYCSFEKDEIKKLNLNIKVGKYKITLQTESETFIGFFTIDLNT